VGKSSYFAFDLPGYGSRIGRTGYHHLLLRILHFLSADAFTPHDGTVRSSRLRRSNWPTFRLLTTGLIEVINIQILQMPPGNLSATEVGESCAPLPTAAPGVPGAPVRLPPPAAC